MQSDNSQHRASARVEIASREAVADKARQSRDATTVILNALPNDLGRNRILNAEVAAAFWGVSVPHWRRLYRAGKVPRPIKVGERKLGWRIGVLTDALEARECAAA